MDSRNIKDNKNNVEDSKKVDERVQGMTTQQPASQQRSNTTVVTSDSKKLMSEVPAEYEITKECKVLGQKAIPYFGIYGNKNG